MNDDEKHSYTLTDFIYIYKLKPILYVNINNTNRQEVTDVNGNMKHFLRQKVQEAKQQTLKIEEGQETERSADYYEAIITLCSEILNRF